ncbi:MAG: GNAT family N-acetyltransferase [Lutibacter sp.]
MTNNNFIIREISIKDNPKIAKVIRTVLLEFGVPKVGTAYADIILDQLYQHYNRKNAIYYVIEKDDRIYGGGGIMHLENFEGMVCELQKMYFLKDARGIGLGGKLMKICLQKAKSFGYEKCYLETLPYMKDARKLYKKVGFKNLNGPMGNTGHYSCNVWMIKDL